MVGIAAMVVVLQVSVDGPVMTPAAPSVLPSRAESADGVAKVAAPDPAAAYLAKMHEEFWPQPATPRRNGITGLP